MSKSDKVWLRFKVSRNANRKFKSMAAQFGIKLPEWCSEEMEKVAKQIPELKRK